MDQLEAESACLIGGPLNNSEHSLLNHMSVKHNRMRELLFAYLAIELRKDCEPARKLIAGQRLELGLHTEYVAATCCYGETPTIEGSTTHEDH